MKRLVLSTLVTALAGCATGVSDCAALCTALWECRPECSIENLGSDSISPLWMVVCNNTDTQAEVNDDCVGACSNLSDSQQAQALSCVNAASNCADAAMCP